MSDLYVLHLQQYNHCMPTILQLKKIKNIKIKYIKKEYLKNVKRIQLAE